MIAEILREAKCCLRCCLRISGEHSRAAFALDSNREDLLHTLELKWNSVGKSIKDISQHLSNDNTNEYYCSTCLGALQDSFLKNCADKVAKALLNEEYDSDSFSMNAIVPNCLGIRQHSLYLHFKEQLRDDVWKPGGIITVKDALKNSLIEKIENEIGKVCHSKSQLRITIVLDYEDDASETAKLPNVGAKENRRKRKNIGSPASQTIGSVQSTLDAVQSMQSMLMYSPCPPKPSNKCCYLREVTCFHESIIVAGRYNKFSRELSQTPWFIDGVRKTETSVQELACEKIAAFFRANDVKFISAGREDVDVRMLGSGRPFAVELINPRRTKAVEADMKNLEMEINQSTDLIAVNRLGIIAKKDLNLLKEGEEQKIKLYRARIYAKNGVSDEQLERLKPLEDLVIKQKTPIRVLHRRALAVREKTIHRLSATRIDTCNFNLFLSTQAGTYIKEFVHGDFRRTAPSLGTLLGTEVDILELDVEEVKLEWPPPDEIE